MLQKNAVQAFKKLYQAKFGEALSDAETVQKANKILDLYRLIYGSLSLEQIKKARENAHKINNL